MIFSIAYSGKIWTQSSLRQIITLLSFTLIIIVIAFFENTDAIWLNALDAIVAVGLGTSLFVLILKHRLDLNRAFAVLIIFNIGYCFVRNWMFAPTLSVISQQMTPMYESYMQRFAVLKMNKDSIAWIQNFMLTYQSAIWGSMQVSAAFFGILLFNRMSVLKLRISLIRIPHPIMYVLIAALALSLYPLTRIWGINLLVCMGVIYLIQGTAVLSFAWGGFFAKARFMRTFLIIAIIINYPVLILIALVGVLDIWFDFRKLTFKEEKHESDIS